MPATGDEPPAHRTLQVAGVLTQLTGAANLLLGTIAFVLLYRADGALVASIAWALAAMACLAFGTAMHRGGLISVIAAAVLSAGFAIAHVVMDQAWLQRVLGAVDETRVHTISRGSVIGAAVMAAAAVTTVVAIPQAIRYGRWWRRGRRPGPLLGPLEVPTVIVREMKIRWRLYLALTGIATAIGVAVGVLFNAWHVPAEHDEATTTAMAAAVGALPASPVEPIAPLPTTSQTSPAVKSVARDPEPIEMLLDAQRVAIMRADATAIAARFAASAFGFGIDANELAEGRDAIAAQIVRALGAPPTGGFIIESKFIAIGEVPGHAWIAQELAISGSGVEPRRFAITQLAAQVEGMWNVVAVHWAHPVPGFVAMRKASKGSLPIPSPVPSRMVGSNELDAAVRAAFSSRETLVAALAEHPDAFNFGSTPGERIAGTAAIQKAIQAMGSSLRMQPGAIVVDGSAWDPAQRANPAVGVAALIVDVDKPRRGKLVTQPVRVLAVLIRQPSGWRIVQLQWSTGGPIT
ncbi:MAG: nuclear transport factor 2 family protein [Kofleriaceae bacterium]